MKAKIAPSNSAPITKLDYRDIKLTYEVFRSDLRPLLDHKGFGMRLMDILMNMFQIRDHSVALRWHNQNKSKVDKEGNSTYKPLLRSYFVTPAASFSEILPWLQQEGVEPVNVSLLVKPLVYTTTTSLQPQVDEDSEAKVSETRDNRIKTEYWVAVVINVEEKKLFLVDPTGVCSREKVSDLR